MCEICKRTKKKTMKSKEDYEAIEKYVNKEIIGQNRAVSMTILHELCGLEIGNCCYHQTLQKWLQENFLGPLPFLAPKPTKTEVVINSSTINAQNITVNRQINVSNVTEQLRDDILKYLIISETG